jgi:hypothetical protein
MAVPPDRIDSLVVALPRSGLVPLSRTMDARADDGCEISRGVAAGTVDVVALSGGGCVSIFVLVSSVYFLVFVFLYLFFS